MRRNCYFRRHLFLIIFSVAFRLYISDFINYCNHLGPRLFESPEFSKIGSRFWAEVAFFKIYTFSKVYIFADGEKFEIVAIAASKTRGKCLLKAFFLHICILLCKTFCKNLLMKIV